MTAIVRLPIRFDANRLGADCQRIRHDRWISHFNQNDYRGAWQVAPLRSVGGLADKIYSDPATKIDFADTPLLDTCEYFREVLASFVCPLKAVRLMSLAAGAEILEHRDLIADDEARLHIPIVTHADVEFVLDGEQVVMQPGECWYLDFNLPHSVKNLGDSERIHLVIDCVRNPWLNAMIAPVAERAMEANEFTSALEVGELGVFQLKRMWASAMATRRGEIVNHGNEHDIDRLLMNGLGLGVHQTIEYLFTNAPTFDEFEAWVVATVGKPDRLIVDRLNAAIAGQPPPAGVRRWLEAVESSEPVLTSDDLAFWEENGYVVVKNAVTKAASARAESAIWSHIGAEPATPETWYRARTHGTMVELIQHPDLEANRRAARIHKAFSQLWGTVDLWGTADRCGFHPPQREDWPFPGPDLHWDLDFARHTEFGTQGILYLTDTPPEQGALTLVPGFQRRLSEWLRTLEPNADPQQQDLHALGSVPIGGQAGDLIIWHHALPHGSRPNLGTRPRIVQYINMSPLETQTI